MKTLIVAAATGEEQRPWARRVVNRINALVSDAPAVDLSDVVPWNKLTYPFAAKLNVWKFVPHNVERVIWIDTDIYVARPIFTSELPEVPFAAVPDPWVASTIASDKAFGECALYAQIPVYFNSGFFAATRAAIPAFEYAISEERCLSPERVDFFREQDIFNWAVWKILGKHSPADPGWHALGAEWNFMYNNRQGSFVHPVVVHLAGTPLAEKRSALRGLYAGAAI